MPFLDVLRILARLFVGAMIIANLIMAGCNMSDTDNSPQSLHRFIDNLLNASVGVIAMWGLLR